jgi:hypothetical protein
MTTDTDIVARSVPLGRINHFYLRRVLQRWQRGEIDKGTAIDLLHAAAFGRANQPAGSAR